MILRVAAAQIIVMATTGPEGKSRIGSVDLFLAFLYAGFRNTRMPQMIRRPRYLKAVSSALAHNPACVLLAYVIYPGFEAYPLHKKVEVVPLTDLAGRLALLTALLMELQA